MMQQTQAYPKLLTQYHQVVNSQRQNIGQTLLTWLIDFYNLERKKRRNKNNYGKVDNHHSNQKSIRLVVALVEKQLLISIILMMSLIILKCKLRVRRNQIRRRMTTTAKSLRIPIWTCQLKVPLLFLTC
jgi:hypothetical protein